MEDQEIEKAQVNDLCEVCLNSVKKAIQELQAMVDSLQKLKEREKDDQ